MGKNISKNRSSKYSQKILHHAKQSVIDVLTLIQKERSKNRRSKWGFNWK